MTKRAVVLWVIMLILGCFLLFVAFGAVDLMPQRQRPIDKVDSTKDVILATLVCFRI